MAINLYINLRNALNSVGMVIGDEAHLFKAVSLTKILAKLERLSSIE